jgi:MFS family permease
MRGLIANKMLANNKVIKALTLTDFAVWSGSSLIATIFPLFVITQIEGATVTHAGISSMIYMIVPAILNMPFGKLLDKMKGYNDELNMLTWSNIIRGISLIALAFTTNLWVFFLLQAVLGAAKSMNTTSWRVLFSRFLDTEHLGREWSIYDTVMSVGLGIAAYLGGFLGENWGFQIVVLIGGIMSLIGAIFPLFTSEQINDLK